MRSGQDDPEMAEIAAECEQACFELFKEAAIQEKVGRVPVPGRLHDRPEQGHPLPVRGYITNLRMNAVGLQPAFAGASKTRSLDQHLAVVRQRAGRPAGSGSEFLVGQIDSEVNAEDLGDFEAVSDATGTLTPAPHAAPAQSDAGATGAYPGWRAARPSRRERAGDPGAPRSSRGFQCRSSYCGACRTPLLAGRCTMLPCRSPLSRRVSACPAAANRWAPSGWTSEALRPHLRFTSANKKPPDCSGGFFTSISMLGGRAADAPPAPTGPYSQGAAVGPWCRPSFQTRPKCL